ncbi:HAMP domain-containing sensor histidine kinase [Arenibacter sp. GZD96]|uniref:sensor histidine kinase n=1 Tax=Aurantibrevibacter litoralis TaxID=3106030 RepID=UPI002AFF32CE|nr:HAMP domain-containing sensor histidine kinase [Arenibacter sp. GZD-96]MEA1786861.1 HAMP domain-containing sensor histidine kinase [Arenibacter sp. GZD-96]
MKKRNLIIVIFVVSVLGLAYIQYKYLEIGLNLAKVQFNKKIAQTGQIIKSELTQKDGLTFLLGEALLENNAYFKMSVDSIKDASNYFLNDYITSRLVDSGIEADFTYSLYAKDSTYFLKSPKVFTPTERRNAYPIELEGYLPSLVEKRLILELQFRDIHNYFLFQLNGLTIPSLLFMLAIVAVVVWVLRSFYWQRNIIMTTNEFVNNLTHELRTPVFAIGLATKILEEDLQPKKKPILKIIKHELDRLNAHIDKVLEMGSLESGKTIFKLTPLDMRSLLQNICEDFKQLTILEDVQFSYELESGEYIIKGEASHLENAVNNVLDNAKKYAEKPQILLQAFVRDKKVHIAISDNGRGISKADKSRIFQKYYRVPNGNLYQVKGYGLGLNYVKKVMEGHRAKIKVESAEGVGTTITLIIPLISAQ